MHLTATQMTLSTATREGRQWWVQQSWEAASQALPMSSGSAETKATERRRVAASLLLPAPLLTTSQVVALRIFPPQPLLLSELADRRLL